ncbi:hypothetical protein ACQ5SP_07040 [Rhodovulum sp. YNF3179]|uniref:hypothetical protein n=1 Tax=Rhodovulum sp. YNF3179 TaxID=3425127 RepID=UPI003D32ED8B
MTRDRFWADPRGLIHEAYRIEGITEADCRSIFLDWALGLSGEADTRAHIAALLERHGAAAPDHPMTQVLRAGLDRAVHSGRRGGRAGRARRQ